MSKTKVALVLSGGVSLGAYIAGALDELMRAFRATDMFEIDVITGTSAGATNAALIAHGLLYRDGETDLYDVWVKKIDMVELLAPDVSEHSTILSGRVLANIANQTISWPDSQRSIARATCCSSDLIVAMTLANSTSLPYRSRLQQHGAEGPEEFVQYRSAEQEAFDFSGNVSPQDLLWQRIGSVARASAALPFVFPMVQLERDATNRRHYLPGAKPAMESPRKYWYYDGGTYNNLPIDLAWHYIRELQPLNPHENRRIVVVSPGRTNPTPVTRDVEYPGLLEHAFGIFRDHRAESRAIQFNGEVVMPSRATGQSRSGTGLAFQLPGVDRPPVEVLERFALVLPAPNAPPLRGVFLHALSAFLDERFREYDFRRGAADARRLIIKVLGVNDYDRHPDEYYRPDDDAELRHDIRTYTTLGVIPSTRDPDRTVRQVFEHALDVRLRALIRHWDAPGPDNFITDALLERIIKGMVHERLPKLWHTETE